MHHHVDTLRGDLANLSGHVAGVVHRLHAAGASRAVWGGHPPMGFAQSCRGAHAIGLCGALTSYSTFGYETVRLLQERARFYAALNAVASVVAGLGAAFCGIAAAQAIWP